MAKMQGKDNQGFTREGLSTTVEERVSHREWDRFEKKDDRFISWSSKDATFRTRRNVICKIIVSVILFIITLGLVVTSKLSVILLTSQLKHNSAEDNTPVNVAWIWSMVLVLMFPEGLSVVNSVYKISFKTRKSCGWRLWSVCLTNEFLHSMGLVILVFLVLPNLTDTSICLLATTIGIIPTFLRCYVDWSQTRKCFRPFLVYSVLFYIFVVVIWTIETSDTSLRTTICLPISILLISSKWINNYSGSNSFLRKVHKDLPQVSLVAAIMRILTILIGTMLVYGYGNPECVLTLFYRENYTSCDGHGSMNLTFETLDLCGVDVPFIIGGTTVLCGFACYIISLEVCRAWLQIPCFSLPIALSVPVTFGMLLLLHEYRTYVPACIGDILQLSSAEDALSSDGVLSWLCKGISWILFLYIAGHIFTPSEDKLISWNKLFSKSAYCNIFLGESLALSRTKIPHDEKQIQLTFGHNQPLKTKSSHVIACITMWHESEMEMSHVIKSIFRLDLDLYAKAMIDEDKGSYGLEAHIFLDDAFLETKDGRQPLNQWSKQLIQVVRNTDLSLRGQGSGVEEASKPQFASTPYGGRLVWSLPGGTLLTAHLKDSHKVKHKKRWSQVMYMYYFLGYRLSEADSARSRCTFLLVLDGDVDFQEDAVEKLLDRMMMEQDVGAACGRIHPVGAGFGGPILWYQRFEYAVSHWLQKATEHVAGCVLCSPGCFSMFRASALMDKDVLRKYATPATDARHFVQYDQGEDRWLCTLLLQRGYRIEYCAAADSSTFAPEAFGEFFNQRKRWSPSTMSNTVDLLTNWNHLTKKNNNISSPFLVYQTVLLICLLLTPGTIFLLIVGAINFAFPTMPLYGALLVNLVPVATFTIVCLYCDPKTQVKTAGWLCVLYTLTMMVVLVGLLLQAVQHGVCSSISIFLIIVTSIFFSTALLHPQEFTNIFAGIVFFFFTPTMSMLLTIYSLCNLDNISWGTREKGVTVHGGEVWTQGVWVSLLRCFGFRREQNESVVMQKRDKIEKMVDQKPDDDIAGEPTHEAQSLDWIHENSLESRFDLEDDEEIFWNDVIGKYLKPDRMDNVAIGDVKTDLKNLRNKSCLLFLVLNSLLVVLVATLKMYPDLNIRLPCESVEFSNDGFEPISFTFMAVFGILLVIQFVCMLIHRNETMIHIFYSTDVTKWIKKLIRSEQEDEATRDIDFTDGFENNDVTDSAAKRAYKDNDTENAKAQLRIMKYLIVHNFLKDNRPSKSGTDLEDYESKWRRVRNSIGLNIEDRNMDLHISDIARKTNASTQCVKSLVTTLKKNQREHGGRSVSSATRSNDETFPKTLYEHWDVSAQQQINKKTSSVTMRGRSEIPRHNTNDNATRYAKTSHSQQIYKEHETRRNLRLTTFRGKHDANDSTNVQGRDTSSGFRQTKTSIEGVRPYSRNRVSPEPLEQSVQAVVHTVPTVNVDNLTNETKL